MTRALISMIFAITLSGMGHTQNMPHSLEPIVIDCKKVTNDVELLSLFHARFIPLESCAESFIKRIEKVVVTKDHCVVWDRKLKTILIFRIDGTFLRKISSVGKPGPGEFLYCYDIDVKNDILYILSYKEILMYDMNLRFLRKVPLEKSYNKFIVDNNWAYLYRNNQTPDDREKLSAIDLFNPDEAYPLLFEERQLGMLHIDIPIHFCVNQGEILFSYPLTDTIYSIHKSFVFPKYILDFKGRKFPAQAFDNIANNPMAAMTIHNKLMNNKKYAFMPSRFVKNSLGTYLWFISEGKPARLFRSAKNSVNSLATNFLLDENPISFILAGFTDDALIICLNPWDLSDNLRIKIKNQGYNVKEDSNPILAILSSL